MANPRALVNALHQHWDTIDVLVRMSRQQIAFSEAQVLEQIAGSKSGIDAQELGLILRNLVNSDVLQPLPRSSDVQINPAVLDFVRALTLEHELGLSEILKVRVEALRDARESINQGMLNRDLDRVRRAAHELGELIRQIMQQLGQDRHALFELAEQAKGSDTRIPLEQRYRRVNEAYDKYIEPMNQLMDTGREGLFYRHLEEAEKSLDAAYEQLTIQGGLYTHCIELRRIAHQAKELRRFGREVLQQCADTLLPLRDELRLHNGLSSAISTLLGQTRKRGLNRALKTNKASSSLPLWGSSRSFRLNIGDDVRGLMADFRNYEPIEIPFPADEAAQVQEFELVNEQTILSHLTDSLPVGDLLLWLKTHYGHYTDDTLLRLFHEVLHSEATKVEPGSEISTINLQNVRVIHYPHEVSISDEH